MHINKEKNERQSETEIMKQATERAKNNIFFNQDFSNYDKIDTSSVMYLDYPKSWLHEPSNQRSNTNFTLSKNDINNVRVLFKDPNYNPIQISDVIIL